MPRLLVVDDDSHIREVLRFALERAGHHVREAGGASEAVSLFNEAAPPY